MKFRVTIHACLNLAFLSLAFCFSANSQAVKDTSDKINSDVQQFITIAESNPDTQSLNAEFQLIKSRLNNYITNKNKLDSSDIIRLMEEKTLDSILLILEKGLADQKEPQNEPETAEAFNDAAYEKYINNKLKQYISENKSRTENKSDDNLVSESDSIWLDKKMMLVKGAYNKNLLRIIRASKKDAPAKEIAEKAKPSIHPFVQSRNTLNSKLKSNVLASLKQSASSLSDTEFENKQGFLKWPLSSSAILYYFGENTHQPSKSRFYNNGIDFSSSENNLVTTIHDGVIARLFDADNGTQSVIIKHSPSYISTYSNIKIGNVQAGDSVKSGQVIGICASENGAFTTHFQIWKEDKPQNPRHWLKNR